MNSTLAAPARTQARTIVHRTHGKKHGPVTRLMSPGDLGQRLKPFVFLDLVDWQPKPGQLEFGMHPHSGIATLTYLLEGKTTYEDSTGKSGVLPAGGIEWMSAGNGVWHDGGPVDDSPIKGFQLWVALPASQENAPPYSVYLEPLQIPEEGPATVLLGRYGAAQSSIPAPTGMNYLAVRLKDGERWRYTPPAGHTVGWVAVNAGQVDAGDLITTGELAIFEDSDRPLDFVAKGATSFVLGSAVKHPHDLVMGYYSVHTSQKALAKGEQEIQRIAAGLRQAGRLR